MRREGELTPFLVAFPTEDGGHQLMVDPLYFTGLDEAGGLLAELAHQYALAFVQSGRALDMADALEQIEEFFSIGLSEIREATGEEG